MRKVLKLSIVGQNLNNMNTTESVLRTCNALTSPAYLRGLDHHRLDALTQKNTEKSVD
jgi:hypothetical protein